MQEIEYVFVVVGAIVTEPLVAPLVEKLAPVQLVALVDDQVRIVFCPDATEVGFAESDAVTAGPYAMSVASKAVVEQRGSTPPVQL